MEEVILTLKVRQMKKEELIQNNLLTRSNPIQLIIQLEGFQGLVEMDFSICLVDKCLARPFSNLNFIILLTNQIMPQLIPHHHHSFPWQNFCRMSESLSLFWFIATFKTTHRINVFVVFVILPHCLLVSICLIELCASKALYNF